MPSAPQPDDEVVEVFVGDTLEEAMAYAVAALGPDLVVTRARKVRKGVQGLVGKDKYEVLASPGASSTVPADAVDSAFDALLHEAERSEDPAPRPAPVRRVTRVEQPPAAPEPVYDAELEEEDEPEPVPVPVKRVKPLPPVVEEEPVRPVRRTAAKKAPVKAAPRAAVVRTRAAQQGWSRTALADLGVPDSVLDALPEDDPADDLSWAAALAAAIATVLPPPTRLSEEHPLVVAAHGVAGALALLNAAGGELAPGTITVDGRTVPATASELALVIRTAIVTGG